ncbi:MAG: hypothetical protein ACO1RA_02545 [Planctomycetaceae bacterium]
MCPPIRTGDAALQRLLAGLCCQNSRLLSVLQTNSSKINRKFSTAKSRADKFDVFAEIEIANLLLKSPCRVEVEFEPYGTKSAGPDLRVRLDEDWSNLEVKRIAPTNQSREINEFLGQLIARLKLLKSSLGFSIDLTIEGIDSYFEELQGERCGTNLLEQQIAFFENALLKAKRFLKNDGEVITASSPFMNGLEIKFSFVQGKSDELPTSYFGEVHEISFTNKEQHKFSDKICDCLSQCKPDQANVLIIMNSSDSHCPNELQMALHSLFQLCEEKDDAFFQRKGRKKFNGYSDFSSKMANLSAAYVRPHTAGSDGFWINQFARNPLPPKMHEFLQRATST